MSRIYGTFEGWIETNALPWETYDDAKERYEKLYGEDEPLDFSTDPEPVYKPEEPEEEEGFLDSLGETGEWFSDLGTGLGRGVDQLQGTIGTQTADYIAANLPESLQEYEQPLTDYGNEMYYRNLREAEAYGPRKPSREEQNKLDDPDYQKALTKEEFIKQNPDHWKSKMYRHFPEWLPSWEKFKETAPTAEQLGEMIPSSITPSIVGRTAGGLVGSVGGAGGTYLGQMAGGASASSLMTAAEVSREIRDNPTVRKTLGLDPNVSFQEDTHENRNRMNKLAKVVFRNSFANRLTSSGIPEMVGYASFGRGLTGVLGRAVLDVGGGTTSELLDLDMSRRSIVESLQEFAKIEGNPLSEEQLAQINQTLFDMGPKKREIFSQAFVSELLLGAPGSALEGALEVAQDHRVDEIPTDTAEMERMKNEIEKEDNKRLEIVGGAFAEIETMFDDGNEDGAYELYTTINKENRKQNALSDLLQKKRYDDIYKSFLERDNAEETAQEVQEEVDQAETDIDKEKDDAGKEADALVDDEVKDQDKAEKDLDKEIEANRKKKEADDKKAADDKKKAAKKTTTKKTKTTTKKKEKKKGKGQEGEEHYSEIEEEVVELLQSVEKGGAPSSITANLKRIAKAVGVKISKSDKPIDVINNIKAKAMEDVKPKKTAAKKTSAKKTPAKKTPVKTTAPKTLIDRYNNALRNPKGETRITMPETHRNKDNTIKDVLIEWEDGSDTFTRAELQELGAIQKKGDRESYVANTEVKVETKVETTEDLETILEDEGAESVADNVDKDTTVPVESIYTEDVKGRLSGLNKQYPKGMTEEDVQLEEMSQTEDKKENAGKKRDLTIAESNAAEARGTKKFAKALVQVQKNQKKTTSKPKTPKKGDKKTESAKYVEAKMKEWNKKNKKATPKENEAAQHDFAVEFLNKEKTKKLETTIEEEAKEAEAKKKAREEGAPVEAETDGNVLSSATGRKRKKKESKSKRTKGETKAPGISKEGVQSGIETFKKNSKQKIKDMNITALSKDDDADVEIVREIYRAEYDSRGLDPAGKDEWVENNTQAIFEGGTEGFVDNRSGNIYMVADNIMAIDTSTSAIDRLAQVLFHETIGHAGLKAFLGAQFDTFINRFLKTNNKLLKRWATEGTGQVYLPKELRGKELKVRQKGYDKMSSDDKFTIAEEYIAQHFAEHGARDPNLIDRIAIHIARALNKQGLWENMTTNEVKLTLTEVQQEYIGGNRNFITGENFRKVPLHIYQDDEQLEGETGDVEGTVEGIREAGLLSEEELEAHLADNPYTETEVEVEPDGETVSKSIRIPKKTVRKLYKLMEIRDGRLYYPFVEVKGKEKLKSKPQYPVNLNEWQNASFVLPKDMPGQGRGMGLAPRGGFHLTENLTPHLMTKLKDGTTRVWVEVEIGDDTNYQNRTGEFGKNTEFLLKRDKDGNVINGKVPEGGQYRFRRPAREGGWWRIAGEMRLLRILPESESNTLLNQYVISKPYTDALARSKSKGVKKQITLSGISKSIKLYHGSPKRFNKFIMDHVSTGAHGWGLYFSDYKPIAKIYSQPKGYLYGVNVPPKMGEFLDFNKSMDDQSGYIKERVKSIQAIHGKILPLRNGEDLYDWAASWNRTQKEASLFLSQYGIKGNKTAPSKFTNLGTKVYVLFNPDDVLIKTVTDEKTGKVETIESRMVNAISQSKSLGLYAKYKKLQFPDNLDKDSGIKGSMLLHKNPRPNEGKFRITFFDEEGTPRYHKHFPTLRKAKDRLEVIGEDIQDISGGMAIRGVSKSVRKTFRDEKTDSTMDWVQDRGMRGAELDREYLDVELRWLRAQEEKNKLKGVSKSVRKRFSRVLDEEMQKQDVKIDPVAHAKASEKRMAEARRANAQRESLAKTYGRNPSPELRDKVPSDTVVLSKEGIKKYLESKTAEGDGSVIGGLKMSKRLLPQIDKKTRKGMLGQNAVAMVADRIKLGSYTPIHGDGSSFHNLMERLHGGPDYAFESENRSKDGETYGVWASAEGRIVALANAIKRMGTQYGVIVVGNPEQHMSNMDVWNVMWGETRDAAENGLILENGEFKRDADGNKVYTDLNWINDKINEFKDKEFSKSKPNPKNLEETLRWKEPLFTEEMKPKIKDFNSLMEQGVNLPFDTRAYVLKTLFGNPIDNYKTAPHIESKANGVALHRIIKRTSAYPDAEMGDIVGIVKFKLDKDGNAIFGKASEIGIKAHPSYDTVIQGEGIINYKKSIPMREYAKAWLMAERETGQKPFWKEGQVDFEDGAIYTSAMLDYIDSVKKAEAKGKKTRAKMPEEAISTRWITAKQKKAGAKRTLEMKPDAGLVITKEMFPPEIMLKPHKKVRTKSAINASKRLISQSVNYSNSRAENYQRTRVASKGRGPLAGLARKLTRRLISQGTLEDFELYKTLRRKTKGTIMKMEQTADKFYKIIKNSRQQKEIYDYLTTPNADKTKITDVYERQIVVQVKKEIRDNGEELVNKHHLMTRKTLERLDDQYLPRKYLKYLLRDKDYNLLNSSDGNLGNLDLSYLNKRQDIEKGVRELILGEVKDPAFLAATAFATPRKDMALLDFMQSIATEGKEEGRGWVLPKTLVTFDTMGLMKQLAGESTETRKLIDELELMETKGVMVSGHWLVNEAERIQNMTKHMELTPEKTLLVKKLTDRMAEAGKGIVGDILPKEYMRVPKGRKYGTLQGMAIRKEIFEDLFGWSTGAGGQTFNINDDGTMDRNMAEKILGTGGTFEQYNRFWKWSKVSANPPSWVRNFVSNLIFMNLGPVPMYRMPDLFIRSLKDQISTRIKQARGDKNNEVYDEAGNPLTDTARADIMGLTSGGFSQVELKMIKSNFEEAVRRGDPQEGLAGLMTIRNAFKGIEREETIAGKTKEALKAGVADPFKKYIQRPTSDLYGGIDSLGKIMMIKYLYSDKAKKPSWEGGDRQYTLEEAAAEAEKWLFDYSNPLPSVKYLRKSAFGAPFLSYPSFVAPLLIETILTKPWKFVPHLIFGEAMLAGFKWSEDISDEEYEAIIDETSPYLKSKAKGGNLDKVPDWVPVIGGKPWIPRSVLPVFNPFSKEKNLDENGRAQLLEIGYLQPWGMFSDIFRQLDPTKKEGVEPAQALHTFGMLSSPLMNIATTILTNRDPFTDREIYDEFATGGEKLAAWYHYMWNLSMPPMVHGMSQVGEGKGFGALTRLVEHYMFTVTKEGEAKHTQSQALWRMIGINITPIAPHEARAMNVKREVGKINRLKRRIKKNAEDAFFRAMSIEDIKEMVKKDAEKLEELYKGIEDRLSKPLPAKLKRTEKQRIKIMNEFLRKRKAG